jgi:hypothetical protein
VDEKVDGITALINKKSDSYGQRRDNFKWIIRNGVFRDVQI